jgi:sugar lactone lactonase YvrE
MVVDRHGRAHAGEMGFALDDFADPRTAALIRIDPDGSTSVAAQDLYFPNGSVMGPDGGTSSSERRPARAALPTRIGEHPDGDVRVSEELR